MGSQDPASYFSCPNEYRRKLGELQDKDRSLSAHQVEENGSPAVGRIVDNIWTTMIWGWRTTTWWRNKSAMGHTDVEVGG